MKIFAKDKDGHFVREINGIKLPFPLTEFMKMRKWGYVFSALLMAVSLFFIVSKGFNWGLDFTGGVVFDTHFSQSADLEKIRGKLHENGMLQEVDSDIKIRSVEFVGPNVGEELAQGAVYATLATLAMMLVYVGSRFEWRLGFGGIASLAHDVIITLGVFSALQIEIDLTFVAAILSVVGYSINDSIVVFDRVRENFRKIRRLDTIDIIDVSLTQTLSRTIMTSATTLIVVIALFFFGGPSIHNFSLALLVGIGFGTYSSIFIAIAIAYDVGLRREHMIPPKVDKEIDELP